MPSAPHPALRLAGPALAVLTLLSGCTEPTGIAGNDLGAPPVAFSHGDFDESDGIYRIPYADGLGVVVSRDHHDHTPVDRIDMYGEMADYEIVAAASGWIRAIVDRHGNDPGAGDGLSADESLAQDDALEHSCTDDDTVEGSCSDYNNYVWIEHPNGEWTKYSHFGTGTVNDNDWEVGDWIEAGEVLGLEGDIGAASGRHLHYEVGLPFDPADETPFSELGGFMVPSFGDNLVPRTCDLPDLLYETDGEYTANPCEHDPPTADAGGPYEVDEGSMVLLDGSGSDDPDGLPLTFAWTPAENLDDPAAEQPMFLGVDNGVVDLTLTVYDQVEALSDMDETSVTVANVPPSVTISGEQETLVQEGATLQVLAEFSDPGVLDAPFTAEVQCYDVGGYSLTVDGTVEVISDAGPLTGTVTAQCPLGDTSESGDPPAGTFTVSVTVTDKDGGTGDASFEVAVTNVAPSPVLDLSGATLVDGVPTVLATPGEPVEFDAQVTDPGSDDLVLTWDWDDATVTQVTSLLDDPNPDPFPSPTVDPRELMDLQSHAFAEACLYQVVLTGTDDDGGEGTATAAVVVTGEAETLRGPGYWMTHYRGQQSKLDPETLTCYLAIVGHMSSVFDEETPGTGSFEEATDVLWTNDSRGDMAQLLERHLMTAWLNFANGAIGWDEMVDTDGDQVPDMAFSAAVTAAEVVRMDPAATRQEMEDQKGILENINESGGG